MDLFVLDLLTGKSLTDSTNLFSPKNFFENDDIILSYFMANVIPLKHLICIHI